MSRPVIIYVEVSGATATGKTAVMARIRNALNGDGYTVASPDLELEGRAARPQDILAAPSRHRTVVVLSETNLPAKQE